MRVLERRVEKVELRIRKEAQSRTNRHDFEISIKDTVLQRLLLLSLCLLG